QEELVYARPDVDIDSLVRIGRRGRVVGTTYVLQSREAKFFAPEIESMIASLSRAVPNSLLSVIDSSVDEQKLLVLSRSDRDPGVYYIFDRATRQLNTFVVARAPLEGIPLAAQKAVTFPAADGTPIPAYLTLPPGREDARGLPALVMPHGGPASRDEWGFDWLAQYFAARGFAVLQPNFRGSSGYGETWYQSWLKNGFRSWQVAIGDVLDAGRWLTREGIADPAKLAIFGWSYGGYAALQSAVVEPSVFRAVIAVAPVTDLQQLKEEHRYWSDFDLISEYVGDGAHMREGSPAERADRIKVPVMLFHGEMDR